MSPRFGRYVVYVDESGDHGLASINPEFPVFVLAFCIFRIEEYTTSIVPAVETLKFEFFGHDMVVLHEREIRKATPPFDVLLEPRTRERFMARLSGVITDAPFTLVASAIRKEEFRERRGSGLNPYNVALEYGLERVFLQLQSRGEVGRRTAAI